mmetsp:Transcript_18425/g.45832  ORF Transcript_18425/g.45832 Transcript_18425/m.45832 type:complete len:209 (-) Transcript_18425:40-666(-)
MPLVHLDCDNSAALTSSSFRSGLCHLSSPMGSTSRCFHTRLASTRSSVRSASALWRASQPRKCGSLKYSRSLRSLFFMVPTPMPYTSTRAHSVSASTKQYRPVVGTPSSSPTPSCSVYSSSSVSFCTPGCMDSMALSAVRFTHSPPWERSMHGPEAPLSSLPGMSPTTSTRRGRSPVSVVHSLLSLSCTRIFSGLTHCVCVRLPTSRR